ncbi:MAG: hypothetical protein SFT94_08175, partial [Pseudanabaenaceae cyanobacterium bins.68]|nr:hypothetical protein [Pseudanabaenaceae cyanobacterium bins.68]
PTGANPYVVRGTIDGLQIGSNSGTGITATVTNTPTGELEGTVFNIFVNALNGGDAFTVDAGGNVTFADAFYRSSGSDSLFFGGFGGYIPQLAGSSGNPDWITFSGQTTFTPATPVPFEFNPVLGLGVLGGAFVIKKKLVKKGK